MNTAFQIAFPREYQLDRGILAGIALSVVFVGCGILFGGSYLSFIDIPSALMVFGGTFGATLVHFSPLDFVWTWRALIRALRVPLVGVEDRISHLVRLSQQARLSGMVSLDREARFSEDPFMRQALELAVDGHAPEEMRRILEIELRTKHEHAARAVQVLETLGSYAPALGLIGTLVGLIQMLRVLGDASQVGSAMSLALVTTLYGALLANLVFLPLAGKLRLRAEGEALLRAVTLEGALSLSRQENPIVLEQRLRSFLPPTHVP